MSPTSSTPMELERWEWEQLKAVVKAARALHDVVGDGDNGPAPSFMEAWDELDEALEAWDKNEPEKWE